MSPAGPVRAPGRTELDDLIWQPSPGMDYPTRVGFTRNGSGVTFLAPEPGGNVRSLWLVDLASGAHTTLAAAGAATGSFTQEEQLRRQRRRETASGITDYRRAADADLIVAIRDRRCLVSRNGQPAVELPGITNPQALHPDPTGRRIAYVTNGDLWVVEADGSSRHRLTDDAEPGVSNGLEDYLAAEELDRFEGAWWNAAGTEILFAYVDERDVPQFAVTSPNPDGSHARPEVYRYPFAGGPNPRTTLRIASGDQPDPVREVRLDFADGYLARVVPHPMGGWLVASLPRDQRSLHWHIVAPSGSARELWVERSSPWINLDDATAILSDGRVLRASETSGYRHIEIRAADGTPLRQLTTGEWVVTDLVHVDERRGEVLFLGTADGVLERHLYIVPLDSPAPVSRPERLTAAPGWHEVTVSDDGSRWVDSWSSRDTPMQVVVRSRDGSADVVLHAPSTDPQRAKVVIPELLKLRAADGVTELNVALFRAPAPADATPPTVVWVYGGPHSQFVRDSWELTLGNRGAGAAYRQALLRAGFNVVMADNRGTANRGLAFESTNDGSFGSSEVDDQAAVLEALALRGEVDLARVAITGSSYGGYLTVLAMARRPDLFAAGVAGAPVVDWTGYDSAYTERYLGLPKANAAGYRMSSLAGQLSTLRGRLLILHGTVDENVHPRHTAWLRDELRAAGNLVTVVMLPHERHLLANPEAQRQWLTLALEHLLGAMSGRAAGVPVPPVDQGGTVAAGHAAS